MSKTDKLPDYVVTEEDYKADLASGLSDDEVMKPGTYKVRRSPWAEKIKKAGKVKITIYLDGEIVEYFKSRSEQPNAAPYQTQINNELRKVIESGARNETRVDRDILKDIKFLKALKKKLEAI